MLDIAQLALATTTFLASYLPDLLKLGEKAGEEVIKKSVDEGWDQAKGLWAKLRPKVEAKPAALEAAQEVAVAPTDEDAVAALRLQLRKLLTEDEPLAQEVNRLLKQAKQSGVNVTASGDRAVAAGGNVSGSTIVTGDRNRLRP